MPESDGGGNGWQDGSPKRVSHSGGAGEEASWVAAVSSDGGLEGEGELWAHASLVQDHLLIQAHFLLLLLL